MNGRDRLRTTLRRALLAGLLAGVAATAAQAHPGGLDKQGCHTNRKTGEYHCHRGAPPAASAAPRPSATQPLPFAPAPGTAPTPVQRAAPRTAPGRAYRNCAEARAAGAAPVRRGDPGYGPHLDRDNDGIGCEPYRGR